MTLNVVSQRPVTHPLAQVPSFVLFTHTHVLLAQPLRVKEGACMPSGRRAASWVQRTDPDQGSVPKQQPWSPAVPWSNASSGPSCSNTVAIHCSTLRCEAVIPFACCSPLRVWADSSACKSEGWDSTGTGLHLDTDRGQASGEASVHSLPYTTDATALAAIRWPSLDHHQTLGGNKLSARDATPLFLT